MSPKQFGRCFGILLFVLSSSAVSMDLQFDQWKGRRKGQLIAAWGNPRQSRSAVNGEIMSYQIVALKATGRDSERKRIALGDSRGDAYYVDSVGNVVAESEKAPGKHYAQLVTTGETYSILNSKSPEARLTACIVHVVVDLSGIISALSAMGDRESCARIARNDLDR